MTDVVVKHLITDQKGVYDDMYSTLPSHTHCCYQVVLVIPSVCAVRMKCRDLVKKIAIYKNRLAVSSI